MPTWIIFALSAAFLQNARSALQRRVMTGALGGVGATYSRFCYGLPFAAGFFLVATLFYGGPITPSPGFAIAAIVGGLAQILATATLLTSFKYASFAVGTGFSKLEPVLAAVAGALILGEAPGVQASIGILVSVAGVYVATVGGGAVSRTAALYGISSAALFGLSAVSYRAGSMSLGDAPAALRATQTLAAATLFQTIAMGGWMRVKAPEQLKAVWKAWKPGLIIGVAGAGASACWFNAFTLEPVAHVRTLGQIELVFTALASILLFKERPRAREWLGIALVILGVIVLLTAAGV